LLVWLFCVSIGLGSSGLAGGLVLRHVWAGEARLALESGRAYERVNRTGEAIEQYRAVLERCPDQMEASSRLTALLCKRGRADEALSILEGASESWVGPNRVQGNLLLASAARKAGELDVAARALNEALGMAPASGEAHAEVARLSLARGDAPAYLRSLDKVAQYGTASSTREYAQRWREWGDRVRELEAALARGEAGAKAWFLIGDTLMNMGKWRKAREAFSKALRGDAETKAAAHYWLGLLAEGEHKAGEARRHYAEAVEISHEHPEAKAALTRLDTE
jgi:tetratricopeptide (TPR) repeat protein